MGEEIDFDKKKSHTKRHAGRKAEKKKSKNEHVQELTAQQKNPKAFTFNSAIKAQKNFHRTQDFKSKKHHIPVVDRTPLDPPPVVVSIVGGPKSGKSTLLRCLIKNYTRQKLTDIRGPVTVVVGKKRRVTFIEVNNDVNCMVDIAKVSDIVLMLIDSTFGIEMEVFEFLEICRAHGTPRVMGILNHLDMMKDNKALKKKKKILKHRFQVELYPGAKLFYLSGIVHGEYLKKEVQNLGRFIMVMKFRPITWRITHPYVLVDRYEDITNQENIRINPKCDRDVVLYGYVRGVPFQSSQKVHIPGCGDFKMKNMTYLPDPCPRPEQLKKRALNSKERLLFAPMSGVGGVLYDKDAVYIDLGGSHHGVKKQGEEDDMDDGEALVQPLLNLQKMPDEKQAESKIQIFSHGDFITSDDRTEDDVDEVMNNGDDDDGLGEEVIEEGTSINEASDSKDGSSEVETRRGLPAYETIVSDDGVSRRRVVFSDNLEDDLDDDDDEEEEDDDDDEDEDEDEIEDLGNESDEDEEEHALAPPKKKLKNNGHMPKREEGGENSDENDSDDCDVDGDLQNLLNIDKRKANASTDAKDKRVCKVQSLKTNKDSDVTAMVQGILQNIKTPKVNKKVQRPSDNNLDSDYINKSNDPIVKRQGDDQSESDEESSEEEETSEDEEEEKAHRTDMFKEAADNFYKNQSTVSFLRKYIYGNMKEDESGSEDEDDTVGGIFQKPSNPKMKPGSLSKRALMDGTDTSRYIPHATRDWDMEELINSIKDCFVTGQWKEGENAETLLKMDDEDEDLYGDFEDLETGEKFIKAPEEGKEEKKNADEIDEDKPPEPVKAEMSAKEKRIEKKRRLKASFDAEYDEHGDGDHFEALKKDMNEQAELNRKEFESLDDDTRVQYEGFRSGMYVRMEFEKFPCEFITNFDPSYPVIVGGLLENESNMGYVRIRIKVHRWYPKILKNRDPLILSLGWRRFQSMMYYAKREDNFRMRSLKYARKYLHVEAMFWGPVTPVNTGFVAFQNITDRVPEFRIAANGVVLESDQSSKIVKKLKLIGYPVEILKKTAFIKDMFHTEIEVAKFIGAQIQTQSGIRGIVKKSKGLEGVYRATFEDVIRKSDVVVMKTWAPVELSQHCFCVRTLLLPSNEKAAWQGMKTVAQVKKEKGIRNEAAHDSLYTPITKRCEYTKMPLRIPKELQKSLPYHMKPKNKREGKKADRVLVVKDPHEVKMDDFMDRLKVMMADKIEKQKQSKALRKGKYKEEVQVREAMRNFREKKAKKEACRKLSKKSGSKNLHMA